MSPVIPRRLLPVLLGMVVLGACSAPQLDVVVLSARAPGTKCAFEDDTLYVSRGSLDFRPYTTLGGGTAFSGSYGQVFSWENNMQSVPLVVNGQTVDDASGNDFVADQAVLTYQYSDPSVTLPSETENLHAVVSAGCPRDKCSVGVSLIGPGASAILDAALGPTPQTLLVTFVLTGKTTAGRTTQTNEVTFPLTVYKSDTTPLSCPTGTVLNTGVCGVAGRDTPVDCIIST